MIEKCAARLVHGAVGTVRIDWDASGACTLQVEIVGVLKNISVNVISAEIDTIVCNTMPPLISPLTYSILLGFKNN